MRRRCQQIWDRPLPRQPGVGVLICWLCQSISRRSTQCLPWSSDTFHPGGRERGGGRGREGGREGERGEREGEGGRERERYTHTLQTNRFEKMNTTYIHM